MTTIQTILKCGHNWNWQQVHFHSVDGYCACPFFTHDAEQWKLLFTSATVCITADVYQSTGVTNEINDGSISLRSKPAGQHVGHPALEELKCPTSLSVRVLVFFPKGCSWSYGGLQAAAAAVWGDLPLSHKGKEKNEEWNSALFCAMTHTGHQMMAASGL